MNTLQTYQHPSYSSNTKALDKFSEQLTNVIVEKLKKGIEGKWDKNWIQPEFAFPQNIDGRKYTGINVLMLALTTEIKSYNSSVYLTFLQAKKQNIKINKGEISTPVVYCTPVYYKIVNDKWVRVKEENLEQEKKDNTIITKTIINYYNVFNIDQTNLKEINEEKYKEFIKCLPPINTDNRINEKIENTILNNAWICPIQEGRKPAYYPIMDIIKVPNKDYFISNNDYYNTLLHEMIHSTGAPHRLNRNKIKGKNKFYAYGREELVAELGAVISSIELGVMATIQDNNLQYINGWLNNIKEEPEFIKEVLKDSKEASKLLLSIV